MTHALRRKAIIVFAKNPVQGKVKTRLAVKFGHERALTIYQQLLRHTREVCQLVDADRHIFYSDFIDEKDEWSNASFHQHLQSNGDIGQRMLSAFLEVLKANGGRAILVGSDIPGLRPEILEAGFERLEASDFCLGPAQDGGYYLLGMKAHAPWLFTDMPWSTAQVAKTTLHRIAERGMSCALLPRLSDIDYPGDWEAHGHLIA